MCVFTFLAQCSQHDLMFVKISLLVDLGKSCRLLDCYWLKVFWMNLWRLVVAIKPSCPHHCPLIFVPSESERWTDLKPVFCFAKVDVVTTVWSSRCYSR